MTPDDSKELIDLVEMNGQDWLRKPTACCHYWKSEEKEVDEFLDRVNSPKA